MGTPNTFGIVGFGNQAKAWAQNLKNSGRTVCIFLRTQSTSEKKTESMGFETRPFSKMGECDELAILIPDDAQPEFCKQNAQYFRAGQSLIFAHGFSLHFQTAPWPKNCHHLLFAPKSIGIQVRSLYKQGKPFPAVYGVHHAAEESIEALEAQLKILGKDLGAAPLVKATVKDEVVSDLLSEQVLLCGAIPTLIEMTFKMLVDQGINPDVAYLECVHEMGIFSELFQKQGFAKSLKPISPTARFGAYEASKALKASDFESKVKGLLSDIQSGGFVDKLNTAKAQNYKDDLAWAEEIEDWKVEKLGHDMRKKMV